MDTIHETYRQFAGTLTTLVHDDETDSWLVVIRAVEAGTHVSGESVWNATRVPRRPSPSLRPVHRLEVTDEGDLFEVEGFDDREHAEAWARHIAHQVSILGWGRGH